MKLINSSVTIIPQEPGLLGVYKQIELAGRTAYKSEDRITEDSAKKFVDMLLERGHTAPLEHGTIYLKVPFDVGNEIIDDYNYNPYSYVECGSDAYYITTNARVIYENGWQEDLQYLCEPTEQHEKRITARFICSRAIGNELVRHRVFSFVQESSRYCNYSKNKFGNELTFVLPEWCDLKDGDYAGLRYSSLDGDVIITINGEDYGFGKNTTLPEDHVLDNKYFGFLKVLDDAEIHYLAGIDTYKLTPQQARDMLPLALKTEVVMTGTESQWKDFFKLRCDQAAHPDMRKLVNELKEKMQCVRD